MCQNSRNEFSFEILIMRRFLKRALLSYLSELRSGLLMCQKRALLKRKQDSKIFIRELSKATK
jgi:hypothetical protein